MGTSPSSDTETKPSWIGSLLKSVSTSTGKVGKAAATHQANITRKVAEQKYDANKSISGTPSEVVDTLFQRALAAWEAVDRYEQTSGGAYVRDSSAGVLYKVGPPTMDSPEGTLIIDPEGTKLMAAAISAEDRHNNYAAYFKGAQGNGSGASYLSTEKDRVAEAERHYNDYIQRIGDISQLEAIAGDQVKSFSQLFQDVAKANTDRKKAMAEGTATLASPKIGIRAGKGPNTDYAAFANAIKGTLPGTTPGMAQIDPSALAYQGGGGVSSAPTTIGGPVPPVPMTPVPAAGVGGGPITTMTPPTTTEMPPGANMSQPLTTIGQPTPTSTPTPGVVNLGPGGQTDSERIMEILRRWGVIPTPAPTGGRW